MKKEEIYIIINDINNKEVAPTDLTHNDIIKLINYIQDQDNKLSIITKDFEKIYYENQKLKQELERLKNNRI